VPIQVFSRHVISHIILPSMFVFCHHVISHAVQLMISVFSRHVLFNDLCVSGWLGGDQDSPIAQQVASSLSS